MMSDKNWKSLSTNVSQEGIETPDAVIAFLGELSSDGYEAETSYVQSGWKHCFKNGIPSILVDNDCWIVEYRLAPQFSTGLLLERIQQPLNTVPPRYRVFQAD